MSDPWRSIGKLFTANTIVNYNDLYSRGVYKGFYIKENSIAFPLYIPHDFSHRQNDSSLPVYIKLEGKLIQNDYKCGFVNEWLDSEVEKTLLKSLPFTHCVILFPTTIVKHDIYYIGCIVKHKDIDPYM